MMTQLQNVPAIELKIDKTFVQHMHARHADLVMVEKIIEMGHELGMEVIAEEWKPTSNSIFCAKKAAMVCSGISFQPRPSARRYHALA